MRYLAGRRADGQEAYNNLAEYTPPKSAEELLSRYDRGEFYFQRAELQKVDLVRAKLWEVDLIGAQLQAANLMAANLGNSDFWYANLEGAILKGADLWNADFKGAILVGADLTDADARHSNFENANLDGANLTNVAFSFDADLLIAKWETLNVGDTTYHRKLVESGEQILPFGMGPRLSVLINTDRLNGEKIEATSSVVDYLAAYGIQAEVTNAGGAGSIIKLSVRSKDDANILLQAGNGVCRLLGLGCGVENLLPEDTSPLSSLSNHVRDLSICVNSLQQSQQKANERIINILSDIGRNDVKSVKLDGFTDEQMTQLRQMAEWGSEYLSIKINEQDKALMMTVGQRVGIDIYESQVAQPLRTILGAVFKLCLPQNNLSEPSAPT